MPLAKGNWGHVTIYHLWLSSSVVEKATKKQMRNEAPLPAPPPTPRKDRLPTQLEPPERLAPSRPSQLSCTTCTSRTPSLRQPRLDLEMTSLSRMLWAISTTRRKEGWRHVSPHVLPPARHLLPPPPPLPFHRRCTGAGRRAWGGGSPTEPSFALPRLWSLPPSRHLRTYSESFLGSSHQFRSRPASPGSRVAHGAPHAI